MMNFQLVRKSTQPLDRRVMMDRPQFMSSGKIACFGYSDDKPGSQYNERGDYCLFLYDLNFVCTQFNIQTLLNNSLRKSCPQDIIFDNENIRNEGNIIDVVLSFNEQFLFIERFMAKNCVLSFPLGDFIAYYSEKDSDLFTNPDVKYERKLDSTFLKYFSYPLTQTCWFDYGQVLKNRLKKNSKKREIDPSSMESYAIQFNNACTKIAISFQNFDVEIYDQSMNLIHAINFSKEVDNRYSDYLRHLVWSDDDKQLTVWSNFSIFLIKFEYDESLNSSISTISNLRLAGEPGGNIVEEIPLWNKNQTDLIYIPNDHESFFGTKLINAQPVNFGKYKQTIKKKGKKYQTPDELSWDQFNEFNIFLNPNRIRHIVWKSHPGYHCSNQSEFLIHTFDGFFIFKS